MDREADRGDRSEQIGRHRLQRWTDRQTKATEVGRATLKYSSAERKKIILIADY